jgi:hypothetical protein
VDRENSPTLLEPEWGSIPIPSDLQPDIKPIGQMLGPFLCVFKAILMVRLWFFVVCVCVNLRRANSFAKLSKFKVNLPADSTWSGLLS